MLIHNVSYSSRILEGHADAITAVAFTPDSLYIITACSEGTWRLFEVSGDASSALIVCEGHDLGVQGCDFSPIMSPYTAGTLIKLSVIAKKKKNTKLQNNNYCRYTTFTG